MTKNKFAPPPNHAFWHQNCNNQHTTTSSTLCSIKKWNEWCGAMVSSSKTMDMLVLWDTAGASWTHPMQWQPENKKHNHDCYLMTIHQTKWKESHTCGVKPTISVARGRIWFIDHDAVIVEDDWGGWVVWGGWCTDCDVEHIIVHQRFHMFIHGQLCVPRILSEGHARRKTENGISYYHDIITGDITPQKYCTWELDMYLRTHKIYHNDSV